MFIEKMWMTPLEFRRNGIEDKHIVPTGLKSWRLLVFYKHSVPTGLKNTTHILQFTIMSDIVPKTLHTPTFWIALDSRNVKKYNMENQTELNQMTLL